MGLIGFYRVLQGFTEFYWVLLGFTGFYWVLLGFTGFYWVFEDVSLFFMYEHPFPFVSWPYSNLGIWNETMSFLEILLSMETSFSHNGTETDACKVNCFDFFSLFFGLKWNEGGSHFFCLFVCKILPVQGFHQNDTKCYLARAFLTSTLKQGIAPCVGEKNGGNPVKCGKIWLWMLKAGATRKETSQQ